MRLAFWKSPPAATPEVEALIAIFYGNLLPAQRNEICLPWDYADERRGLVRGFIANHWQVTRPGVLSDFFTAEQQAAIYEIFCALLDPRWRKKFLRVLKDDTQGHPWGKDQSIGFLGTPGEGPWQFLFTGRHLTLRAQGSGSSDFVFGAPIVYGHAAKGFYEKAGHRDNVFWPQAVAASRVHRLLDPPIRAQAEVDELPVEYDIMFREQFQGAPVAAFPRKAKAAFQNFLQFIMQPYRDADRQHINACLEAQGGIDCLHLAFARKPRMSAPLWDVWRIEGPAFVWHFQGSPHVHAWVHVAATPQAGAIRARHGTFLFPGQDELR